MTLMALDRQVADGISARFGKRCQSPRTPAMLCLLASFTLWTCDVAPTDDIILRVGHTLDTAHPVHLALAYMDERLRAQSGGRLALKIYANGQLGSEREMIELVQIGALGMTKVSAISMEGFVPEMAAFGTPYLFRNQDHYWEVLDGVVGADMLARLAPAMLHGLGYFDAGSRSFYMADSPIRTPGDLQGKNVRVLPSPASISMVDAFGGTATSIPWGELYTALQQGVVDGAENNPPSYLLSRQYEAAPYFSLNEHTSVPDLVVMSVSVWNDLSSEQQSWLADAMADASRYQRDLWAEATADALDQLEHAGVTVTRPDTAPFRAIAAELGQANAGTEIGRITETIAAVGQQEQGKR